MWFTLAIVTFNIFNIVLPLASFKISFKEKHLALLSKTSTFLNFKFLILLLIFKCLYEIYLCRLVHKWGVFVTLRHAYQLFWWVFFWLYNFLENWGNAHYNLAFSTQKKKIRVNGIVFFSHFLNQILTKPFLHYCHQNCSVKWQICIHCFPQNTRSPLWPTHSALFSTYKVYLLLSLIFASFSVWFLF